MKLINSLPKTYLEWFSLIGITFLFLFTLRTSVYYSNLLGQVTSGTSTSETLVILFQLIVHNLVLFVLFRPRSWGFYFLLTFMTIEFAGALQVASFERLGLILIKLLAVYFCRHRFLKPSL